MKSLLSKRKDGPRFRAATVLIAAGTCLTQMNVEQGAVAAEPLVAGQVSSLQAMIEALPRAGGTIELPAGVHEIGSSIVIRQRRCITIVGAGGNETPRPSPNTPEGSVLRWAGEPSGTLLLLRGVENLTLQEVTLDGRNKRAGIGIDVQTSPTIDTSSLLLRRMGIAYCQTGVRIGSPGASNNDTSVIEDITFRSNDNAVVFDSNQAVGWNLRDCHFIRNGTGVRLASGGGFLMLGCSFGVNDADIDLASISDSVTIIGSTFERVEGPAIKCESPAGNPRMIVQIMGCRIDTNVPNQPLVEWRGQAHLLMQGNRVKNGTVSLNNAIGNPAIEPVHTLIGNWFHEKGSGVKLDVPTRPDARYAVFSYGNQTMDGEQAKTPPQFRVARVSSSGVLDLLHLTEQGLGLGSSLVMNQNAVERLGGLSGTAIGSRNLRGSVTIRGPSTSARVVFARREADPEYFVALGVRPSAGRPSAGSLQASYASPAADGFTINVQSPPGAGNSVAVDWHLIR